MVLIAAGCPALCAAADAGFRRLFELAFSRLNAIIEVDVLSNVDAGVPGVSARCTMRPFCITP